MVEPTWAVRVIPLVPHRVHFDELTTESRARQVCSLTGGVNMFLQ